MPQELPHNSIPTSKFQTVPQSCAVRPNQTPFTEDSAFPSRLERFRMVTWICIFQSFCRRCHTIGGKIGVFYMILKFSPWGRWTWFSFLRHAQIQLLSNGSPSSNLYAIAKRTSLVLGFATVGDRVKLYQFHFRKNNCKSSLFHGTLEGRKICKLDSVLYLWTSIRKKFILLGLWKVYCLINFTTIT